MKTKEMIFSLDKIIMFKSSLNNIINSIKDSTTYIESRIDINSADENLLQSLLDIRKRLKLTDLEKDKLDENIALATMCKLEKSYAELEYTLYVCNRMFKKIIEELSIAYNSLLNNLEKYSIVVSRELLDSLSIANFLVDFLVDSKEKGKIRTNK